MPCWAYLVGRMLTEPRVLIFGDFCFNVPTRELPRIGNDRPATPVSLGSRAAEILLLFLRKPGELVSKNEIMDAVWPGTAVEESNLTVQISALRRALVHRFHETHHMWRIHNFRRGF